MATDYKIVVVPDTGGTRPCIECPQCLGLQLLCVGMNLGVVSTGDNVVGVLQWLNGGDTR